MRRAALLVVLTVILVTGFASAQQSEEKAWKEAWDASNTLSRRHLMLEFVKEFPNSKRVPEALWRAAQTTAKGAEEKALAYEGLKRLVRDHPDYLDPLQPRLGYQLARLAGWTFSPVPPCAGAGPGREVAVQRKIGPPAGTIRFLRCPDGAVKKRLSELKPGGDELHPDVKEYAEVSSVEVDYRAEGASITLPGEPGFYVVEEVTGGFKRMTRLRIAPFALLAQVVGEDLVVFALEPRTGKPVAGVEVTVRSEDQSHRGRTGRDGRFRVTSTMPAVVIGATKGFADGISTETFITRKGRRAYVTTDRPIYRPNHEVFYKVVGRDDGRDGLAFPERKPVRVEMRDPEGRLLRSHIHRWSETGTVTGSFVLGDEPPIGVYGIVVNVDAPWYQEDEYGWELPEDLQEKWRTTFRVAAYRKPEVRISLESGPRTEEGMIPVTLTAEHASGGPVANAGVDWYAEAVWGELEDYVEPGYRNDPRWWFFAEDRDYWHYDYMDVGLGDGTTDAEGRLRFEVRPWLWAGEYRIHAIVKDAAGMDHEVHGTIEDDPDEGPVEIRVERSWYRPGETLVAVATIRTPSGRGIEGRTIRLIAEAEGDEGGGEGAKTRMEAVTDAKGEARFTLKVPDTTGLWLQADQPDSLFGDQTEATLSVNVAGGEVSENEILVYADRWIYEPGDSARLLLRAANAPIDVALTVTAGRFRDARLMRIEKTEQTLEVPIVTGDAPVVVVRLNGYRDAEPVIGSIALPVYPRTRILEVAATTDRPEYGPGDPVTVFVTTKDHAGSAIAAEVELAIVDESIFQMEPDRAKDIRRFFMRRRFSAYSMIGTFPWDDGIEAMDGGFSFSEGGATFGAEDEGEQILGGGADEARPARVRRRFLDTWHYDARVKTGADGKATVTVEAPDTLSKWRIVMRAISGTDRFGTGTSEATTTKKVVTRLVAPRFLTKGDEGEVAILVRNGLAEPVEFRVALSGVRLEIDTATTTVTIPAGGEVRIDRKIKAIQLGTATLTAQALSTVESDAMEVTIPVRPRGARMRAVAAGIVQGTWTHEFVVPEGVDLESVKLDVTAGTPADAIRQTLPTLAGFPYGCVEQTMSRFLPSVVAGRAMRRLGIEDEELTASLPEMVAKGLMRLYKFQHEDGGWGWWETDATDEGMTAYVVYGLATAERAGYDVDGPTLARGLAALKKMKPTPFALYARHLAGDETAREVEVATKTDEDKAWMVLLGWKDLAASIETGADEARVLAVVIRALHAADPNDARIGKLVQRLLLMRHGESWETTIESAHAVYALSEVVANAEPVTFEIDHTRPIRHGKLEVRVKQTGGKGVLLASASMSWHQEDVKTAEDGLAVVRRVERGRMVDGFTEYETLESGATVRVGDEVRVVLTLGYEAAGDYVLVTSPIAAGSEPWPDRDEWDPWDSWYQRREMRDDRVAVAASRVDGGEEFVFRLKATHPGTWSIGPATAYPMYEPARRGHSKPFVLKVTR